jgi:hypothetical protein
MALSLLAEGGYGNFSYLPLHRDRRFQHEPVDTGGRAPSIRYQRRSKRSYWLQPLVHRLISRRHTVGFKRVWMQGASEERIGCDT